MVPGSTEFPMIFSYACSNADLELRVGSVYSLRWMTEPYFSLRVVVHGIISSWTNTPSLMSSSLSSFFEKWYNYGNRRFYHFQKLGVFDSLFVLISEKVKKYFNFLIYWGFDGSR